ncbi:LytR/AlgR family response regulator transcription factor [Chondrinema litorale]|uniref:LytR/AlgR family response regulator transcription factor n=1 Tax=Chondrinema litorale TaxID=2994555 RepID=UPI002543AE40|nr:LytTR family DNA-binding domain-containing protein [Chondrinema litorale]UZR97230.1 LytTR family DNA-binding domain-containing protein [Chondrinema litorale]
MKIKCLVIDDEFPARKGLEDYINDVSFLELVGLCENALIANEIIQEQQIDLIFLDINMPKLNGLEFLKSLDSPPLTIFTTAYREFAIESYDLKAVDYLMKPIPFSRFMSAVNKAKELIELKNTNTKPSTENHFFIKEDGNLVKILFEDILFIEAMQDYVKISMKNINNPHVALISLKSIEQQLPSNAFIRVHKSFIIAIEKVERIEGNLLHIREKVIPIAKNLREKVLNAIVGDKLWKRN